MTRIAITHTHTGHCSFDCGIGGNPTVATLWQVITPFELGAVTLTHCLELEEIECANDPDCCPGDVTGGAAPFPDGEVNFDDLLLLLLQWDTSDCVADVNGDSTVNFDDVLVVLFNWGPCPCFPQPPEQQQSQQMMSAPFNPTEVTESQWNQYMESIQNSEQ